MVLGDDGYPIPVHFNDHVPCFCACERALKRGQGGQLKDAKVTQVIQDVQVLPSNAAPRAAAVNDNVRQGTAVRTGVRPAVS